jgi:hypothetical protein
VDVVVNGDVRVPVLVRAGHDFPRASRCFFII